MMYATNMRRGHTVYFSGTRLLVIFQVLGVSDDDLSYFIVWVMTDGGGCVVFSP